VLVPGTELWPVAIPLAPGYPTCFLLFFSFGIAIIYHTHTLEN
jgi:hypothetical protein